MSKTALVDNNKWATTSCSVDRLACQAPLVSGEPGQPQTQPPPTPPPPPPPAPPTPPTPTPSPSLPRPAPPPPPTPPHLSPPPHPPHLPSTPQPPPLLFSPSLLHHLSTFTSSSFSHQITTAPHQMAAIDAQTLAN